MRRQEVRLGPGCLAGFGALVATFGPGKIMLVTGANGYLRSGAAAVVEPALAGRAVVRLAGVTANPTLQDVMRGLSVWRAEQPAVVVAAGGGSVLDVAKLVALLGPNAEGWDGSASFGAASAATGIPLIAIPTTAGSGAEATSFATYYASGEKRSLAHALLLPSHVFVDSLLSASMPPEVAAASGLDACAQAIESLWAIGATADSDALAEAALRLVVPCLGDLVRAPTATLRARMAHGALLAGQAINLSRTTGAHALSYALTQQLNLSHGHAVALMLPSILRINSRPGARRIAEPRGAAHLMGVIRRIVAILGCRTGEEAARFLEDCTRALGLAPSLPRNPMAPSPQDLAAHVNAERLGNNPVAISRDEIVHIYERLFQDAVAA